MMISAARFGNCLSAEGRKTIQENDRETQTEREEEIIIYIFLHLVFYRVNQTHIKTTVIQHATRLVVSQKLHDDYNLT